MIKKEVFIGFIMGIIATISGVTLCTLIISKVKSVSFDQVLSNFQAEDKLWMLLALGAIPNLLVFFLMLKKNLDYRARGIVLATMLVAFIVFALNF